jgi:hypothetical protein
MPVKEKLQVYKSYISLYSKTTDDGRLNGLQQLIEVLEHDILNGTCWYEDLVISAVSHYGT